MVMERMGGNQEIQPKNRLLEILGGDFPRQIQNAEKVRNSRRIEVLKNKEGICRSYLLSSLAEEFNSEDEKDKADFLAAQEDFSPAFRNYVNQVRKERLVKMVEVKKMEWEEALERENNEEEKKRMAIYIDACDDLISDLER